MSRKYLRFEDDGEEAAAPKEVDPPAQESAEMVVVGEGTVLSDEEEEPGVDFEGEESCDDDEEEPAEDAVVEPTTAEGVAATTAKSAVDPALLLETARALIRSALSHEDDAEEPEEDEDVEDDDDEDEESTEETMEEPPMIRRKYLRFEDGGEEEEAAAPKEVDPPAQESAEVVVVGEGTVLSDDEEEPGVDFEGEESCDDEDEETAASSKASKEQATVGNYSRYYGYRASGVADPRIAHIRTEWVSSKDVLDIGCNSGELTIALAERYHPQTVRGIDVDPSLVAQAQRHLVRADNARLRLRRNRKPGAWRLADHVSFGVEDFAAEEDCTAPPQTQLLYDCILCLSVTKWVHLNAGDAGLLRLFKRAHNMLRDGGVFVLEPQPWKSYRRRAKMSPAMRENFAAATMRPDAFPELLCSPSVGFSECVKLYTPEGKGYGFDRPIYAFFKRQQQP